MNNLKKLIKNNFCEKRFIVENIILKYFLNSFLNFFETKTFFNHVLIFHINTLTSFFDTFNTNHL